MQVINFNFTKIEASRNPTLDPALSLNTNIEFTNLEKEKIDLIKDKEALKLFFKFNVDYSKGEKKEKQSQAKVVFEGFMTLACDSDESKEISKEWKKKEIPQQFRLPFFNLILKRCSVRALQLEDELSLPNHIPLPQLASQPQQK